MNGQYLPPILPIAIEQQEKFGKDEIDTLVAG